jgi:hypothetical protein
MTKSGIVTVHKKSIKIVKFLEWICMSILIVFNLFKTNK